MVRVEGLSHDCRKTIRDLSQNPHLMRVTSPQLSKDYCEFVTFSLNGTNNFVSLSILMIYQSHVDESLGWRDFERRVERLTVRCPKTRTL